MIDDLARPMFRLNAAGVACDEKGLFVGGVALLERAPGCAGASMWRARSAAEVDCALSARYGLPIETCGKAAGIAVVARALERGEIALAQIAALLLQFPDPLPLAKVEAPPAAVQALAFELSESGLLKADAEWNAKHPRTGTPPNRTWFATVPKEPKEPKSPKTPGTGWPSREVNSAIRAGVADLLLEIAEVSPQARTAIVALELAAEFIDWLRGEYENEELSYSQKRISDQICAALQPPKTLDELQIQPEDCLLGYELHHIVEENPFNILKDETQAPPPLTKFGSDILDDPSNLVWVPRLKHEQITGAYNSRIADDPWGRRVRDVVSAEDYDTQFAVGLKALRLAGVLQ